MYVFQWSSWQTYPKQRSTSIRKISKNPLVFDNRGGGVVIPCKFHIQCHDSVTVTKILKKFFEDYHGTERFDESNSGQQSCPF